MNSASKKFYLASISLIFLAQPYLKAGWSDLYLEKHNVSVAKKCVGYQSFEIKKNNCLSDEEKLRILWKNYKKRNPYADLSFEEKLLILYGEYRTRISQ